MIYLYLDEHTIKLLSLSKAILSQYNASYFEKKHESVLLENGKIKNIDLVASAVKEALSLAKPKEIKEKDIMLILPESVFEFRRYDIPSDISDSAIIPFVKDKVRADIPFDIESSLYDYIITKQNNESTVLFFAQDGEEYSHYQEVFKLLGLSIKSIIPDSLSYFKLFEKTLKKDKKETILYVHYEEKNNFGYLYDSHGLLKGDRIKFKEPIETSIKAYVETLEKTQLKPNRLILAGEGAETTRQDFFTKNVGVWTNPLKKIIPTFYDAYIKLIVPPQGTTFPYMNYILCVGGFIFDRENEAFNMTKKNRNNLKAVKEKGQKSFRAPAFFKPRDILIFLVSFALSFAIIFFFPKLKSMSSAMSSVKSSVPTPTAKQEVMEPTASPTPSFTKESLKIKVLNGTGEVGKATTVKGILKNKGYGEILTGNADNYDYKITEIQVKDDKKAAFDIIKTDLADYITSPKESTLDATNAADVIVIFGSDFK